MGTSDGKEWDGNKLVGGDSPHKASGDNRDAVMKGYNVKDINREGVKQIFSWTWSTKCKNHIFTPIIVDHVFFNTFL